MISRDIVNVTSSQFTRLLSLQVWREHSIRHKSRDKRQALTIFSDLKVVFLAFPLKF